MPLPLNELKNRIASVFPNSDIEIKSLVDDNDHYEVTLHSPEFVGLSILNQQKLFHKRLPTIFDEVHAISLKTRAK